SGTTDPTLGTNYAIYGRVVGGGFNPLIPAGTYTDTINVAVNY
ncbi:MAG: SCPU domain-containing protein, partial [Pantoea sp.]|nr:SCPU domain-containing protein [Pantoea sp.]